MLRADSLYVVVKLIEARIFPRNLTLGRQRLSNFKLAVKFNWIISFLRFEGGSEKFTEVRAGSLSRTP